MLMRLNLNKSITGLDGKEIEKSRLADLLATALFHAQDNDNAIKFYQMAMDLSRDGYRDLDTADMDKIKDFVKNKAKFIVAVQASLETAIKEAENSVQPQEKK